METMLLLPSGWLGFWSHDRGGCDRGSFTPVKFGAWLHSRSEVIATLFLEGWNLCAVMPFASALRFEATHHLLATQGALGHGEDRQRYNDSNDGSNGDARPSILIHGTLLVRDSMDST